MVEWKIRKIRIRNLEIITFISLLIIYLLVIFLKEDTGLYNGIAKISEAIRDFASGDRNAYIIAFLICVGGNSTVLIVIPYTLVIYYLCIQNPEIWIWISLISGIGAALGEIVSYYIGRLIGGAKKVQESEIGEKFHRMKLQFEHNPKFVPIFVFLFALTPLPDDVILVPLGMMKYDYKKTIIPSVIGKTMLTSIICFLGRMAGLYDNFIDLLIGAYPWLGFLRLFIPSTEINPRLDLITFSFIFIFIYLVARVNFRGLSKRFNKNRRKFQRLLIEGGIKTENELFEEFSVINQEKFKEHMQGLVDQYENIKSMDHKFKFHSISDHHRAFKQSKVFIDFFYQAESFSSEEDQETEIDAQILDQKPSKDKVVANEKNENKEIDNQKPESELKEKDNFEKLEHSQNISPNMEKKDDVKNLDVNEKSN